MKGSSSCDRCPEDVVCPRGCTSPFTCHSWAEHIAVGNTRCQWSTAFYITVCAVGKNRVYFASVLISCIIVHADVGYVLA